MQERLHGVERMRNHRGARSQACKTLFVRGSGMAHGYNGAVSVCQLLDGVEHTMQLGRHGNLANDWDRARGILSYGR